MLWSIDKIVEPDSTVRIFEHFYRLSITPSVAKLIGLLELLLSLALVTGLWRTLTYGAALIIHSLSTLSTYQELLSPFGKNHLFIAAIPVLAAFLVLFLLRREDGLWAFDAPLKKPDAGVASDH